MASHTAASDEVLTASSVAADLPQSHTHQPSTFLSLAPTTSASYPRQQRTSPPASIISPKIVATDGAGAAAAAATNESVTATTATEVQELGTTGGGGGIPKQRRSSSLASDESGNAKLRFLKLGPVHWGEGDGKGDWSEVGVAEEAE